MTRTSAGRCGPRGARQPAHRGSADAGRGTGRGARRGGRARDAPGPRRPHPGARADVPVQLRREPDEPTDPVLHEFYCRLLRATGDEAFRLGRPSGSSRWRRGPATGRTRRSWPGSGSASIGNSAWRSRTSRASRPRPTSRWHSPSSPARTSGSRTSSTTSSMSAPATTAGPRPVRPAAAGRPPLPDPAPDPAGAAVAPGPAEAVPSTRVPQTHIGDT